MSRLQDVIMRGTHAARPAAGTAGRLYWETDTALLFRDSGTAWEGVSAAAATSLTIAELDGAPSGTPGTLKFPNGTLTDNGDGSYTYTPAVGGGSWNDRVVTRQDAANTDDDEFNGTETTGTPTGWTKVDSGSHIPTFTKSKSLLSMLHPGGDSANELHALMKAPASIPTGTIIETGLRLYTEDNYCMAGLVFADGHTYGAGKQVYAFIFGSLANVSVRPYTGYNTQIAVNDKGYLAVGPMGWVFLRLKYVAANTWRAYMSPDGVSWVETTAADISYTMTPTEFGIAISSWGSSTKKVVSFEYFRVR